MHGIYRFNIHYLFGNSVKTVKSSLSNYIKGVGRILSKASTIVGTFIIISFAYKLLDAKDVFYICECSKCGIKTIMSLSEMLEHKCEE